MVKLIKGRTKDPEDRMSDPIFETTCKHCGAVFEYNYSDTIFESSPIMIRCPDCNLLNYHLPHHEKKR